MIEEVETAREVGFVEVACPRDLVRRLAASCMIPSEIRVTNHLRVAAKCIEEFTGRNEKWNVVLRKLLRSESYF